MGCRDQQDQGWGTSDLRAICSPKNHLVQPAMALQCRHHIIRCIIRWQQDYFNMWKRTVEALSVAFLQIKPQYVVGLG